VTATHVDGVEVIAAEPAPTGIRDIAGNPVHYKRIRELLLADGRTVYGYIGRPGLKDRVVAPPTAFRVTADTDVKQPLVRVEQAVGTAVGPSSIRAAGVVISPPGDV
jgi:hypothetical protein